MPLFDEELLRDLRQPGNLPRINSYLSSPYSSDINIPGPSKFGGYADPSPARGGISLEEIKQLSSIPKRDFGFGSPSQFVFQSELNDASRRYNVYDRGIDLEDLHAQNQGPLDKLTNGVVKGLGTMGGTFLQGFASIPHGIDAIRKGSYDEVSKQYGWEKDISENLRQFEDLLPNYIDKYERENPMAGVIPFTRGSANFWGDGVIKNLFFGVGAIGNAIVTDLAITAATGGAATLPVIGAQLARLGAGVTSALGKTSVYLSKLATGTSKIDDALNAARLAGANPNQLITLQGLAYAAQGAKVTSGAKWGLGLFNSARTEAAIEAADGEHTITEALINDYKAKNNGESPGGADLEEIKQTAADARNVRFGINMALLTVSNAVQYGSLLRAFTAPAAARAAARGIAVGPGGVRLAEGSLDVFERQVAKTATGKVWDYVKPTLKNVLTEGVYEEGGQFAAEKGTFDYYTRKYKNLKDEGNLDNWRTTNEVMAATIEGLSEQFTSSEGLKNMVIGGISSVIMGGMSNRVQRAMGVPTDNERLQSAVNLLNRYGITGMLQDQYSDTLNAKGIAQEMQDAVDSGNVFKYKNLKHDMFFNLVNSRSRNGMHDVTVEQLKMLKDLDEAEFTKTFGMDFSETNKKTVSSYVDSLIEKANEMNSTITSINESFRNPFVSYDDPKTEEEAIENFKHDTVNEWKTNLAYYSTVASDVDGRLKNIEQDLVAINPLLNNNTASSLTNRTGLKELSSVYEQKAKMLGETITEFTSPADKKSIRNQIKTLRTLSERINLALNNNNLDLKTFGTLLNFELSGQQSIENQQVPSDKIEQIYKLGADINGLLQHKKDAQASVDALSTEGGFDKFFEQAEKMGEEQEAAVEEQKEEEKEEKPAEEKALEFVNRAGLKEIPQTDKEYQLEGVTLAKVKKIADDRYEVVSPLGESTFYGNKEDADQAAEDMNENIQDLQKVKVVAINEDGSIKVEDLAGNIQNVPLKQLTGYERIQTEQEKLVEQKEELTRQQDEIETRSATVATPPPPTAEELQAMAASQGKLKAASKLFISGTTPTELADEPTHVRNSREFLNNAKNFNNRNNLAAILVTPNQEAGLGLSGITALQYGPEDSSNATNIETGLVLQVFVEQENGKTFFVDKNGERIGEVNGQPVDIQRVIFQPMPTTDLYFATKDKDGKPIPRFRADQLAEAEAASKAWGTKRAELFNNPAFPLKAYRFSISRGVAIMNVVDGKYERNQVGGILIPEERIATQEGLLKVVTDGSVVHNGENIKFNNGLTVLQYGDTLQIVNNNKLGANKAKAVYMAIKTMMDKFQQTKKLDVNLANYIQNVLYWRKTPTTTGNQIFINTNTGEISLGGKNYTPADLVSKESEIVDQLKEAFHTVNNTTLRNKFYEPFYEYKVEGDKLVEVEWDNYQSYLLSKKGRSADQTPLVTSVAKPDPNGFTYSFRQKYATLIDFELPIIQAPKPAPVAQKAATEGVPMIGEFEMNGETVNTFNGFNAGPIQFKGRITDGRIDITDKDIVENKTVIETAKNGKIINEAIIPALKDGGIFDPSADDIELVKTFIAGKLIKELQTLQQAAPAPTAAPVSDARADIERRRNEELDENLRMRETLAEDKDISDEDYQKVVARQQANASKIEDRYDAEYVDAVKKGELTREQAMQALEEVGRKGLKAYKELAALEGAKPTTETYNPADTGAPQDEYMRVGVEEAGVERLTDAQIELFKNWAAENVPGIPFEVLDNLVNTYDNEKAWGVFENGVAKFYKGAPGTTPYHEIFEGIWKGFLTPEQRQLILDEFRAKSGQFIDRASGKKIAYEDATDQQAKERIADDFGAFRMGKLPARTLGERITKFFRQIIEFFKSFVQKPSMKEGLFKAIDAGKFKDLTLPASIAAATPEYMRIPGLTETQAYEFTEDMTARAAQYIFGDNKKSLYDIKEITSKEIFDKIKDAYTQENKYQKLGDQRFNQLVTRTKEKLRTLGINFNEEDTIDINDENTTRVDYAPEPFSTDWKKTSPFAIKFVAATLPQVEPTNQKDSSSLSLPKRILSSIKGYKLSSFGRVFNTLMDKLSNTTDIDLLDRKLSDLAKADATYVRFFQRVGGDLSTGTVPFANFKNEDWRLFINFFQTFTKQRPDAIIQYVDGSSVYTAPANQFTSSKLLQSEWFENMKMLADDPKSIIRKNKLEKVYQVDRTKLPTAVPKEPKAMVDFLTNMGVGFPLSAYVSLKPSQQEEFAKAVSGIYTYIQKTPDIGSLTSKTLGINPQLSKLSNLYIAATNPSQDSTYFGVENQRLQSYADNNVPSVMENEFNSADTVEKLKELRPELNDVFSKNSIVLKKGGLFYNKEGKRFKLLKIGTIQGTKVLETDKGTTTSRLTLGSRFTQEINENIEGVYHILVPADSSTEWTINLGNNITFEDIVGGRATNKIKSIFKGYLQDEIALALDASNRKQIRNVGSKAGELRFFKEMLNETDLREINNLIATGATQEQINNYIDENLDSITGSVVDFINTTAAETKQLLLSNNQVLQVSENEYTYPLLQSEFANENNINKFNVSEDDLNNILRFVNTNYVISNIELHKLIFGDPYEFKIKDGKLDETKRVKSFLSPRRTTFDSPAYNSFLNKEYNMAGDVQLTPDDPGYHLFKPFANTVTLSDIEVSSELYPEINEADAASFLMDNTYKEVKLKNGQWTTEADNWHNWQMAYTRNKLAAMGEYVYTNPRLQKADNELISKPEPVFVTEVLKPIVSGVKAGETKIDNVLDKFSQMPLYYKTVEGRALEKLYIKMWKEKIDYAVFQSGRKVGATSLNKLYNEEGAINEQPFTGTIKVAWKSYGIQVENSYENPKDQTRGSQMTKLSSLDLFNDGEATPKAKRAYERNLRALNALHTNAYNALLNRLGLEDLGEGSGFRLVNPAAIQENLKYEMLRREMAENAKDTIKLDENGQFPIPFEASPAYRQIKDILFSMVNKALVSPKMNGVSAVQVPVTGWEKENRKPGSPSNTLKFYTKEDPYMEVFLPHWFRGKFSRKKFPNDEAILKYLNSTEEGKKILTGIGFRIPTQSMSSIEVFRVKGFLPQSMGATIVVPSEVTAKAGSDFDIDKMSTYLRSTYIDKNGDIKLVKFDGSEPGTKEFFANVFDEMLEKKKVNKAELLEATQILSYGLEDPKNLLDKYSNLLDVLLADETNSEAFEEKVIEQLEELGDENLQAKLKDKFVEDMFRRSLENEYYDSLEAMITLPENFNRLVSPVDDAGLSKIATQLDKLRGQDETTIPNRLLNRTYMTSLRNSFVAAKKWIGIAAVNITGHSLTQKTKVYIDPARIEALPDFDKKILGDGKIQLPHNTVEVDGKQYISISGKMTADNKQHISDRLSGYATSFVDVAKDPYIMKIIGSESVVSTFMFLERAGVGENAIWFLNQPIIREYLSYLDSIGRKGLFGKDPIDYIKNRFPTSRKTTQFDINKLEDNIRKYSIEESDNDYNAEQQAIFNEFLKYAKMAEYNFKLTQAINYDTTKFRNSDEFSRKQSRTNLAREKNIFSSVDKILNSSFIGDQAQFIDKAMSSLGEIVKTEKDDFTIITGDVIKPYEENEFMSAEDFSKVAAKVKASFLDFVIQTQSDLNTEIKALVVDNTSVADQLAQAKKRHPEMKILNELQVVSSDRIEGGSKSIRLRANLRDAFDTDMYTDMMRELKVVEPELYNGLLKIALLQGTYQSSISIRNIMPIEDFAPLVKKVIDPLSSTEDIKSFSTSGVFYRNNWKDNTIVPTVQPKFFVATYKDPFSGERIELDPLEDAETGDLIYRYQSPSFPAFEITKDFIIEETDRKILLINENYNSSDVKYDFIKVPRIVTDKKTGERIDMLTGLTVTPATFARRRAQGDLSQRDVFGYQKVKYINGEPLVTAKGEHVYKLVNLYGDGQLVSEYYLDNRRSVINNGTVQIEKEIPDADLIKFFGPKVVAEETVVPSQPSVTVGKVQRPLPGVENIPNSGLTVEQGNQFIDLLQPQIQKQAYVENKARTANMMFSFGLRWARNVPNSTEKSEQAKNLGQPRPDRKQIKSKEGVTYGYYLTDQNNNPLPPMEELQPIMDFIQSKLGIDMSDYDAMLGNIYDKTSFIHQHRDTTESVTAGGYPVIVINLGADGNLEYDENIKSTYASYEKSGQLNLTNGGIYAFGVDGTSRFTFHHRIGSGLQSANPLKPITLPDGQVLRNYRITLTFRRASNLEPGMPAKPNRTSTEVSGPTKVSTPSGKLKLRDGNEYAISDINAQLLEKIGYTPKEIGKLLKAIC